MPHLCRLLRVSRSGFYDWQRREESLRDRSNRGLLVEIRAIHAESKQTYGAPRMVRELTARGHACSENRVARLMRSEGIAGIQRRRFRVLTTDSKHQEPIAENVIAQDFSAKAPGEKLGCDITYIPTREGFVYLAVVIDFYSRLVLGYALGASLEAGLVCQALVQAVRHGFLPKDLVHHSDRGVQYACKRYRDLVKSLGMIQSMSRKGNCYDNAMVESFFHTLKVERVHRQDYDTRGAAIADVRNYIEGWYNPKRRHSSIGFESPQTFLTHWRKAA